MNRKAKIRAAIMYGIYLLLLFGIQSAWPGTSAANTAKPNLLLVFAVLSGYQFGFSDGLAIGLLAGFLLDYSSGRVIGIGMLLLMIAGISAARLFKRNLTRSILPALMSTIICTVFYEFGVRIVLWISIWLQDIPIAPIETAMLLKQVPPAVLKNVLVMFPLFILLRYFGPYRRSLGHGHIEREGSPARW